MQRPVADIDTAGHDSFLDIVSNIVGILIILVMVVGLRIKNAPLRPDKDRIASRRADQLAQHQVTAASMRQDVLDLAGRMEQMRKETMRRFRERDRLATLVVGLEHNLKELRAGLGDRAKEDLDLHSQLVDARSQIQDLDTGLSRMRAMEAQPTVVESYPTPLSRTVDGTELHFQLRGGRVAFIPLDRLIKKFKSDAEYRVAKLRELSEITETVGPVEGFRFRYTLQRRETSLDEQIVTGRIQIGLKQWTVTPVSGDLGEDVEVALGKGSRLNSVLAGYRPETTTVTIWVYPDSFPHFRRLKKELFRLGYATAARPLPDGFPISGSPHGSKSAAE